VAGTSGQESEANAVKRPRTSNEGKQPDARVSKPPQNPPPGASNPPPANPNQGKKTDSVAVPTVSHTAPAPAAVASPLPTPAQNTSQSGVTLSDIEKREQRFGAGNRGGRGPPVSQNANRSHHEGYNGNGGGPRDGNNDTRRDSKGQGPGQGARRDR
jgi:hypothetical protein